MSALLDGLSKMSPPPPADGPMPDDGGGDPLDMAAQDLIDSVKDGDKAGVASALEAAFMALDKKNESEPSEGP